MLQTVIGVVVPVKWAENNHIESVSIQATDDLEYRVAKGDLLQRLISLCGSRVKVLGVVEQRERETLIHVKSVELLVQG
jgi:Zn-finger domain-containing protein